VATLVDRIVFVLAVQGVLLVLVLGPLLARRLAVLGAVYLVLSSLGRLLRRHFSAGVVFQVIYISSAIPMLLAVAIGGGIYSGYAIALIMLTVGSSFVFEIRTTLLTLVGLIVLFGVMSVFQSYGIWFQPGSEESPGVAWVFLALRTVNFAIPIVTTIQAHREALGQLESKVGALHDAETKTRKLLDTQSRFFWDVSHELRSPLTRLNLSVGKVRREVAPQAEASLERMDNEVGRLNKLIHQLLLMAQLKQGVEFPMNERFDLAAEVVSVCEDAEFEANVAGRYFTMRSSGAPLKAVPNWSAARSTTWCGTRSASRQREPRS